ncbi:IS5 family transposase [Streptomyces sp. NRRL F-5755]|uniref:IS5 family transposase n=1 Tax=Streptomyces sp. NRRL F-5755 TaxID=1519475 RepID=UPI00099D27F1|nr:IS5 family transposase [Streptomyces sp. NRRL F-5755]
MQGGSFRSWWGGELTDAEWARLEPHLPRNVGRGRRWKSHRRVVDGILFRLRTGIPWRDLPTRFGSWETVYERHRRWSADGTWERMLRAVQADADAEGRIDWLMVSVDSTVCRAQQHAAGARRKAPRNPGTRIRSAQHRPDEGLGRSRGGLTTKIRLAGEGGLRPPALLVTPGQSGDAPRMIPVLDRVRVPRPAGGRPRTSPGHLSGGKAYGSRRNHRCLRRRHIKPTIPERRDQRTHRRNRDSKGGRSTDFNHAQHARPNEVERTINRIGGSRTVATRHNKRAYVCHGTVTVAALRRWLRP